MYFTIGAFICIVQFFLKAHGVFLCPGDLPAGDLVGVTVDCSSSNVRVSYTARPAYEVELMQLEYTCYAKSDRATVRTGILLESTSAEESAELVIANFSISPLYECKIYGCYEDSLWYDSYKIPEVTCSPDPPVPMTDGVPSLVPTPTPAVIAPSSCSWVCETSLTPSSQPATTTIMRPTPPSVISHLQSKRQLPMKPEMKCSSSSSILPMYIGFVCLLVLIVLLSTSNCVLLLLYRAKKSDHDQSKTTLN